MNKCCKETFIKAIEEVVYTIDVRLPHDLQELRDVLLYAISELKKVPKDESSND